MRAMINRLSAQRQDTQVERKPLFKDEMLIKPHMLQLIRYGLVGVASNVAVYLVYLLITYLGVEPKTAMTLVYLLGATIGFLGNRKWTFAHRGNPSQAAARYAFAHLLGYLLNLLILLTFVDQLGYPHRAVQATAIIVVAAFLFIVFKYFVFRTESARLQ